MCLDAFLSDTSRKPEFAGPLRTFALSPKLNSPDGHRFSTDTLNMLASYYFAVWFLDNEYPPINSDGQTDWKLFSPKRKIKAVSLVKGKPPVCLPS